MVGYGLKLKRILRKCAKSSLILSSVIGMQPIVNRGEVPEGDTEMCPLAKLQAELNKLPNDGEELSSKVVNKVLARIKEL